MEATALHSLRQGNGSIHEYTAKFWSLASRTITRNDAFVRGTGWDSTPHYASLYPWTVSVYWWILWVQFCMLPYPLMPDLQNQRLFMFCHNQIVSVTKMAATMPVFVTKIAATKPVPVPKMAVTMPALVLKMATAIPAPVVKRAVSMTTPVLQRAIIIPAPNLMMSTTPESVHKMSAAPQPLYKMAASPTSPVYARSQLLMSSLMDAQMMSVRATRIMSSSMVPITTEVCPLNSVLPVFAMALWCVWSAFCSSVSCDVSQAPETESSKTSDTPPITTRRSKPEPPAHSVKSESSETPESSGSPALPVLVRMFESESPELLVSTKSAQPKSPKFSVMTMRPVSKFPEFHVP